MFRPLFYHKVKNKYTGVSFGYMQQLYIILIHENKSLHYLQLYYMPVPRIYCEWDRIKFWS